MNINAPFLLGGVHMKKEFDPTILFSVKNKVVFLTGAGGIGEYVAEAYLANEAIVILTNRTEEKCRCIRQKLLQKKYKCFEVLPMDQTDPDSIQKIVRYILEKYGRIDILFNSVGYSSDAKPEDFSPEEIQKTMDINFVSAANLCRIVAKEAMIPQRSGKIINIGSVGGVMCHSENVFVYEASKAAIHQMTKSLALIWAKYNINVNCIAPTWIKTPLTDHNKGDYFEKITQMHYFNRMSELSDYVGPTLFLSSEASSYVSGMILLVDGAWTCGRTVTHEQGFEVEF